MHVLHVLVGTIQAKNGDVFFITVQIFEKNLVLWLTGLGYANIPKVLLWMNILDVRRGSTLLDT